MAYKLYDWEIVGLSEPVRLMFVYSKTPFDDVRIPIADWPQWKPDMPNGQVPALEKDGKMLGQANAIAYFVAEETGMLPKDPWQRAKCNEILQAMGDLLIKIFMFVATDESKKKEVWAKQVDEFSKPSLKRLDDLLGDPSGFCEINIIFESPALGGAFIFGSLTLADLVAYDLSLAHGFYWGVSLDGFDKLRGLVERIRAMPEFKEFFAKHEGTPWSLVNPMEEVKNFK